MNDEVVENGQSVEIGEPASESGAKNNEAQVTEVYQIDYSEQLQVIAQQQQIGIGVSCVICGVILIGICFAIISRYIGR